MKWIFIVGGGLIGVGLIILIIYAIINNQPARYRNAKNEDIDYSND